jgi:hypothetical protein
VKVIVQLWNAATKPRTIMNIRVERLLFKHAVLLLLPPPAPP